MTLFPSGFLLEGHRGARGLAPENTLAGMATALRVGVNGIELDVGMTADGVVIVHHDETINPDIARDQDGNWITEKTPIRALQLDEVRRIDVGRLRPGTEYAAQFAEQRAVDGAGIPTLREVIDFVELRSHHLHYNIEVKTSPDHPDRTAPPERIAAEVVAVLRERGVLGRSILQSFDWRSVRWAREHAPEVATSCLTIEGRYDNVSARDGGASPWTAGFDLRDFGNSVPRMVAATGSRFWTPHFTTLDAERLREAHELGLRVIVWTVNEPADLARMIALGVDGVITDYPDRARIVMQSSG